MTEPLTPERITFLQQQRDWPDGILAAQYVARSVSQAVAALREARKQSGEQSPQFAVAEANVDFWVRQEVAIGSPDIEISQPAQKTFAVMERGRIALELAGFLPEPDMQSNAVR